MNYIKQIVNTESLSNLFLDFRYLINSQRLAVFYLTSLNTSASLIHLFKNFKIQSFNLNNPVNIRKYANLNHQGLLYGYGIKAYDSLMIDYILTKALHHQTPSPSNVRKFNDRLFYLNCTGQSQNNKQLPNPTIQYIYKSWLSNGQLIDLKDISHKHLKVVEANNGMNINYLRPIDKVESEHQLIQVINHCQRKNQIILKLLKAPRFQNALRFRKTLIQNSASKSISISSSLNDIITSLLAPDQKLRDSSNISYQVPGVTSNYLDSTLLWTRQQDRHYHLNHQLVRHFLPVYNAFKNLQGQSITSKYFPKSLNLNPNVPYINAEGKVTNLFTNFSSRFQSHLVNFALLKRDQKQYQTMCKIQRRMKKDYGDDAKGAARVPKLFILKKQGRMVSSKPYITHTSNQTKWKILKSPRLFIKSHRSKTWLINPRYRINDHSESLIIHLDVLQSLLAIKLKCFGKATRRYHNWVQSGLIFSAASPLYRKLLRLVHQMMTTQKPNPLQMPNRAKSIQLITQLIIWKFGETLTLAGGRIIKTNRHEIKVKGLSKSEIMNLMPNHLGFFLRPNQSRLITRYHHLHNHEIWERIKIAHHDLLNPNHYLKALKFFQLIPSVKPWRHRYLFTIKNNVCHHLGLITRFFLVKDQPRQLLRIVKITHAKWYQFNNDVNYHNLVINQAENQHLNSKITCYPHINMHQSVYLHPESLSTFNKNQLNYLYHHLDLQSYFKLLRITQP